MAVMPLGMVSVEQSHGGSWQKTSIYPKSSSALIRNFFYNLSFSFPPTPLPSYPLETTIKHPRFLSNSSGGDGQNKRIRDSSTRTESITIGDGEKEQYFYLKMYEIGVKLLGKGGERLKVSDLATLRICDNLARLNNDLGARVFIPFERIYFPK